MEPRASDRASVYIHVDRTFRGIYCSRALQMHVSITLPEDPPPLLFADGPTLVRRKSCRKTDSPGHRGVKTKSVGSTGAAEARLHIVVPLWKRAKNDFSSSISIDGFRMRPDLAHGRTPIRLSIRTVFDFRL